MPRTPTSRKRTAQYELTQETQWIRYFECDLAYWRFVKLLPEL